MNNPLTSGTWRRWPLLCWVVLVGWLFAGCQAPVRPTYRIGFSQCTNGDAWRLAMLAGMQKELSFYPETSFRMKDAHDNTRLQERHIRDFLREGIDLLIVSANEAEPITPVVEEAYNQGIPVVILDRRITSQQYTAYVGGNNEEVGQIAGRYASSLLHQRGNVLEVLGAVGSSPALDRHRGFAQALAATPGMHLVAPKRPSSSSSGALWITRSAATTCGCGNWNTIITGPTRESTTCVPDTYWAAR